VDLVRDACSSLFDCDDNGRPDTCDLAEHPGWDFNEDGVLDACQSGVTAADPPRAQDPALRIQAHPNPFNPATVLELNLDRAASVRLCIYDVSGRVVRTLVDGEELPAGLSSRTWHGRDDAGRVVSAGVYFYRAVAGEQVVTGSLTLIK
jgi:hypothetical protein